MEMLARIALAVHAAAGLLGLAAFWVPVIAGKGSRVHRLAGKLFVRSAYLMLGAGAIVLWIRIATLLQAGITPANSPGRFSLLLLLVQLLVMLWVILRHGVLVLQARRVAGVLNRRINHVLVLLMVSTSTMLVLYALAFPSFSRIVLIALGFVGVLSGLDMLRYMRGARVGANAWKQEHLGAMLGAGIAYHTAFAVVGMGRFIDLPQQGLLAIAPWLLPTLIGTPAIVLWSRYYRLN